ncbi:MAG TPA: class I SAM-dependent methyltransferase [Streptosporangiaceae bacterium]|nr:class I SAM-dependent methyltransferase [Streptosporangiaceae bacterium]
MPESAVPETATPTPPVADPYSLTPGYYDLFRATDREQSLPPVGIFAALAPAGGSALELGPGTGRVALAVAERVATLYCLERSPSMRAVLLAKLAQRPELWDRVTVLPGSAPSFQLGRRFDYIYLGGVLEHIPHSDRARLFAVIAGHLEPGGMAAMDMVLTESTPDMAESEVAEVRLGECRYVHSMRAQQINPDLSRLHDTYRTFHRDELIATEVVTRLHHMHRPGPVLADLAAAGLVPAQDRAGEVAALKAELADDPGIVVVRKDAA